MIGKTLQNRYKIIKLLGSGGFGDTYLAEDLHIPVNPKPKCVVKHLKPKDANPAILPIAKSLFEREAEFLYRLGNQSNQIPKLFAHFEENRDFYLVQEFIDGHDLTKEITPGLPKSENVVFKLLKDILEVLTVVHQHNIIHRDIKPQNLMRRHLDGKIVLIDFGAVKEISALAVNTHGQTSLTIAIGSPGYMPSEQAKGKPRLCSDIYAVGIIGIQALTGLTPDELKEDPRTGEIVWRNFALVSDRLADVLDGMVRDHFSLRHQSAAEALQALIPTVVSVPIPPMGSQPIESSPSASPVTPIINPPTQPPSAIPTVAKQKGSFKNTLLVGGVLVLMGLGGYAYWQRPRETSVSSDHSQPTPSPATPSPTIDVPSPELTTAEAYYNRGNIRYRSGNQQGAIEDFNQALKLKPNYTDAYINRGLAYYDLKDYTRAIADYNQALKLNPNYTNAYYNRGLAYDHKGDRDRAIADYGQTLKLNPNDTDAYNNRGLAYNDKGDYDRAIADYNQALKINLNYTKAYYNRGLAYYYLKNYNRAVTDYNQALKLNPNYTNAYYNRGLAYYDLKDYDRAIADYNQALKLNPNYTNAYNNRGLAYYYLKDYDRAIADYDQTLKLNPNHANAYYNRGLAYDDKGDPDRAIADYDQTLKLNPNDTDAYNNRGLAYYDKGDYDRAIADYNQALKINLNYTNAYYNRGFAYKNKGSKNKAVEDFKKVLELNNNFDLSLKASQQLQELGTK